MVEQLRTTALEILNVVLNNPPTETEKWVLMIVSAGLFAWLFSRVGDKLEIPNLMGFQGILVPLLGLAALFVAMAAAKIYLYAEFKSLGPMLFLVVAGVAASAVAIVPLIQLYTGGKYIGTLLSWFISLGAAIGVSMLIGTGFDAARGGKISFDRGQAHNSETMQHVK